MGFDVACLDVCDRILNELEPHHENLWGGCGGQTLTEMVHSDFYSSGVICVDIDYPNPSDLLNVFFLRRYVRQFS